MKSKPFQFGLGSCRPTTAIFLSCTLSVTFAAYVAGYLAGSTVSIDEQLKGRIFPDKWQCAIYPPLARIEAACIGGHVAIFHGTEIYGCYPRLNFGC